MITIVFTSAYCVYFKSDNKQKTYTSSFHELYLLQN
jgi:hypothetical protein